jgi:hypothetical protein
MIGLSIFVGLRATVCAVPGLAVILGSRHWHFPEIVNLSYFDLTSIPLGETFPRVNSFVEECEITGSLGNRKDF